MSETPLASLIGDLADRTAEVRQNAAAEIFRRGRELAMSGAREWLEDQEFAKCLSVSGGAPLLTVGVAVSPKQFEEIRGANGLPELASVPPDQDAKEFELEFRGGLRLDILTSRDPSGSGAIARYLQKFHEGIQQIEIETKNIDEATRILRTKFGIQPVYPTTRAGANGTRVNFWLVTSPGSQKVLIELVEQPQPSAKH